MRKWNSIRIHGPFKFKLNILKGKNVFWLSKASYHQLEGEIQIYFLAYREHTIPSKAQKKSDSISGKS